MPLCRCLLLVLTGATGASVFAAGWMMERSSVLKPACGRLLSTARGGLSVKASRLIGL